MHAWGGGAVSWGACSVQSATHSPSVSGALLLTPSPGGAAALKEEEEGGSRGEKDLSANGEKGGAMLEEAPDLPPLSQQGVHRPTKTPQHAEDPLVFILLSESFIRNR